MPVFVANRKVYVDTKETQTVKICTPENQRKQYEKYYRLSPPYALPQRDMEAQVEDFLSIDALERWLVEDRKAQRERDKESQGATPAASDSRPFEFVNNCLDETEKPLRNSQPPMPDPAGWTWSPDVLAFGQQAGVTDYLDPLLNATRELFPTARVLRVKIEADPEILDDRHIVWEIDIPYSGANSYLRSQKRWIETLGGVCPAPLTCVFRLLLMPVPHGPT